MSSYEEWCPVCKSPIVMVTRGIPSMGRCMNGHTSDRRDTLRREPEKVEALPTLSAAMELPEVRVLVEALREIIIKDTRPQGGGMCEPFIGACGRHAAAALAAIKEPKP